MLDMLLSPAPTPYDLRFSLGPIPVRVHPLFWLLAMFLGWDTVNLGLGYLLVWVACVFVSILVHELGHAIAFLYFGARPQIVLCFGGLAIPDRSLRSRPQNIVTLLAGPGAGFLLLASVLLSEEAFHWVRADNDLTIYLYGFLYNINLYWGILNLIPVWPLDGGQVSREVCQKYRRHDGAQLSLKISIAFGGTLAVLSLLGTRGMFPGLFETMPFLPRSTFGSIMFGLLAFESWQALQAFDRNDRWDDRPPR